MDEIATLQAMVNRYAMALLAISTMDVFTPDGAKPAHEVMRDIATTAMTGTKPFGTHRTS